MPISAPRPSMLPSLNRVLALTITAALSTAATNRRAAATSSGVGGSECRQRSVSRTQPMSAEKLAVTVSVPSTTSVEPPPKSTITKGPTAKSNSLTAPRNDSSASSTPVITSATAPSTTSPSTSAVISKKTSRLAASRVADVATMRIRSTPCAVHNAA